MKKLLVSESSLPTQITNDISLQLSSHHMYGLYDFDPERMVNDVCARFDLEVEEIFHPKFILKNSRGDSITLLMSEENYGY